MKSLNPEYLQKQPVTHNLLQTIRRIAEYKGKQDLYKEQSPQILETLRQAAIIQSAESSNRLEGITAPLERIKALVAKKTTPRNRSEQEIAGYRDVLIRSMLTMLTSPSLLASCCSSIETFINSFPLREASGNLLTMRLRQSSLMAQRLSVFTRFLLIRLRTPWRRFTNNSLSSGRLGRSNRFFSFQPMLLISFASILFSMETAAWPDS